MKFCCKMHAFFPLPQILVISSRQVTDVGIQESFGKIPNMIKKKAVSGLHCLRFDYTKRSSDKKTLHL